MPGVYRHHLERVDQVERSEVRMIDRLRAIALPSVDEDGLEPGRPVAQLVQQRLLVVWTVRRPDLAWRTRPARELLPPEYRGEPDGAPQHALEGRPHESDGLRSVELSHEGFIRED